MSSSRCNSRIVAVFQIQPIVIKAHLSAVRDYSGKPNRPGNTDPPTFPKDSEIKEAGELNYSSFRNYKNLKCCGWYGTPNETIGHQEVD